MTKHFSDQRDRELWPEAERGRETLTGLGLVYFGFHVAMLWLFHFVLMLFMLVLFNALVAGLIFMAVLQGNNRARILIGSWAALPGALVLLYVISGSPETAVERILLNGMIFMAFGVASVFFFNKSIWTYQLFKQRELKRRRAGDPGKGSGLNKD